MSIISDIDESMRLGDAYFQNENLANVSVDAKVLLKKVKEIAPECTVSLQNYNAMRKANLVRKDQNAEVLDILHSIESAVKAGRYSDEYIASLGREVATLDHFVDEKWKGYIRKEIGTQKDIIDALKVLVSDTQRYVSLNERYKEINYSDAPGDPALLEQIGSYKVLANKMIQELGLEDSILAFFQKLADREVLSLSELTPEVLDWIRENDFEDKFTIKISER